MNELYITNNNLIFIILNILLFSVIIYILLGKNKEGFQGIKGFKSLNSSNDDNINSGAKNKFKDYTKQGLNNLKSELDQLVEETNQFRQQTTQMENQTKEIEKETQEILTEITELEKIFESISR